MNDRFRLKLWDKINGNWVKEFRINQDGLVLGLYNVEQAMKRRFVLVQCTGLKDKNGKLLYEGDCIKNLKTNRIYEVFWEQQATCFMLKSIKFGGVVSTYMMFEEYPNDLIKIGNKYENKELLNEN